MFVGGLLIGYCLCQYFVVRRDRKFGVVPDLAVATITLVISSFVFTNSVAMLLPEMEDTGDSDNAQLVANLLVPFTVFLGSIVTLFGFIASRVEKSVNESKTDLSQVEQLVRKLADNAAQGGVLATSEDVYKFLCEARATCSATIRMMKIRETAPVETTQHGNNLEVVVPAPRSRVESRPTFKTQVGHYQKKWYDELVEWTSINGRSATRISLSDDLSTEIGAYTKFVNEQMKKHGGVWHSYVLTNPSLDGLIPYNLTIFDKSQMTITFSDPAIHQDTTVWIRNPEIVSFFAAWFDQNARSNATRKVN